MTAEALVLVYDASVNLGRPAVIDAIASVLNSLGDPLEKLWIEDANAGRRTFDIAEMTHAAAEPVDFRYLWAIPRSERRNSKSRWLTTALIDNVAPDSRILFFARPQGPTPGFDIHRTLLTSLVQAGFTPRYGYAYAGQ